MSDLHLRQAITENTKPQQDSFDKSGRSQPTIDLYLRPIAKNRRGGNDIRNYFPPTVKTKGPSNGQSGDSSSPAKIPEIPKPNHAEIGTATLYSTASGPNFKSPAKSKACVIESHVQGEIPPARSIRVSNHNHATSAVLPRFDPFFDSKDYLHSAPPMAPRVTDVVRHSLVPKPLNIKTPPPIAEASRSPSPATSSPSSAGDPDTASFEEERREAPSFKQTYLSVHSRQNTNESLIGPLTAFRDPTPKPLRHHIERPIALRSNTTSKLGEAHFSDNIIYFLPETSPKSDPSVDERETLRKSSYPKRMDKAPIKEASKTKKPTLDLGESRSNKANGRKAVAKDGAVAISPGGQALFIDTPYALLTFIGLQRYYDHLAQKNATPIMEKGKRRETSDSGILEETLTMQNSGSGASSTKKKKGKGLRRLIEAYSKHVEGLQMIQ